MTVLAALSSGDARRCHGSDIVRLLVGAVLLTAAGMKGYELATEPMAEKGLLTSRWFLIAAVEFELSLGLCLVSGLWKRWIWCVTVLCFVGFTCLTAYKAWQGDANCGCFGRAAVDPRYTLVLDCTLLTALLVWRPRMESQPGEWRKAVAVILAALCIGVPGAAAMVSVRSATLANDDVILGNSSFVVLEPEKWAGKRFPLLKHIDIGEQLSKGKWVVVVYSHDCSHCQAMIPKYRQFASGTARVPGSPRIALVEMPPYSDAPQDTPADPLPWISGRLAASHEWFAQTPVEIAIVDGAVVFSKDNGNGLDWLTNVPSFSGSLPTDGRNLALTESSAAKERH